MPAGSVTDSMAAAGPGNHDDRHSVRTPLVIMMVAVLATVLSLFAIGWPGLRPRPRTPDTVVAGSALLPIALTDPAGTEVRVRDLLPAVLLLVDDGCPCDSLISVTLAATVPAVTVVRVQSTATPAPPGPRSAAPGGYRLRMLVDPQRAVRGALPSLRGTTGPAAVLVGRNASTVRIVPNLTSSEQYLTDLHQFSG